MDKKPSIILRAGADILRERGLAQRAYQDNCGRVCVLGACILAATGEETENWHGRYGLDTENQVRPLLRLALPPTAKGLTVTEYNDAEGRTAEEVVQVMLAAAELAEKEGR